MTLLNSIQAGTFKNCLGVAELGGKGGRWCAIPLPSSYVKSAVLVLKTWNLEFLVCGGGLRNAKTVLQAFQILMRLAFFQRKPKTLLKLSNIKRQFAKWRWSSYSFTFYVRINYLHVICENFADINNIEHFYVRYKPNRFWSNRHDIIISWQNVIINKITRYVSVLLR